MEYNDGSYVHISSVLAGPGLDNNLFNEQYLGCSCDSCGLECPCPRFGPNYSDQGELLFDTSGKQRPVFECNSECPCDISCPNRVSQRKLVWDLLVVKTEKKGYGVIANQTLHKHRYLCEYVGELISPEIARERTLNPGSNYVLAVNEHMANGEVLKTLVDARYYGNISRFINHSCNPNLMVVPVRSDRMFARMCLFTNRDIEKGEELSFDYGGHQDRIDPCDRKLPCYCDSPNCRVYMPYDSSLF